MDQFSAIVVIATVLMTIMVLFVGTFATKPRSGADRTGPAAQRSARVYRVIDGDTVIVSTSWRKITIRLDAIDCPEDGQARGDTAKFGLVKLIGGRNVRFEDHGLDKYGRTLGTIFVQQHGTGEWINVNLRMAQWRAERI